MASWVIDWLQTGSLIGLGLAFLVENLLICAGAILGGQWLVARYAPRRVVPAPPPVTGAELAVVLLTVVLNTAVTLLGLLLWRRGLIRCRSDVGLGVLVDVVLLLGVMDSAMYWLHRLAHTAPLYALLHQYHHRFTQPRPLTLFALNPVETLAFGGLWLVVLCLYQPSWIGMLLYLSLNVVSGTIGHLGVEPLPRAWLRWPGLRHVAGASFHAQHHQDWTYNLGFYTLLWDRLCGTLHPDYERAFGRLHHP